MRQLRDKYVPTHHMTHLLLKWLDLKQGRQKVRDYIMEFEQCRMRCTTVDSPEQQITYFICSLRPELGAKVLEQKPATVDLAYKIVEDNEYIMESSPSATTPAAKATISASVIARTPTTTGWTRSNPSTPKTTGPTTPMPAATTLPSSSVDSTARATTSTASNIQYFKCKGFGHRRADCPSLNFMDFRGNMIDPPPRDDPEVDVYHGDCPDDDEECEAPVGVIVITHAVPQPSASDPHLSLINVRIRPDV